MPSPVLTEYAKPWQRMLFCPERNANPFFHIMEGIWMLAGRDEAEWVVKFNKQMLEYAEEDGTFAGAYGFRWRHYFGVDQIDYVVNLLNSDPFTRRAIIAMYNPGQDSGYNDRDVPCNTTIYFRNNSGKLDMTVCCRSNDAVWGAYGANAVHMSMLMEVVAAGTGLAMGTYYQLSNNLHLYTDLHRHLLGEGSTHVDYYWAWSAPYPICTSYGNFYDECNLFLKNPDRADKYKNAWLYYVARPMYLAWEAYKEKDMANAVSWVDQVEDPAVRQACLDWLERRS
jgi:hypothetical protein